MGRDLRSPNRTHLSKVVTGGGVAPRAPRKGREGTRGVRLQRGGSCGARRMHTGSGDAARALSRSPLDQAPDPSHFALVNPLYVAHLYIYAHAAPPPRPPHALSRTRPPRPPLSARTIGVRGRVDTAHHRLELLARARLKECRMASCCDHMAHALLPSNRLTELTFEKCLDLTDRGVRQAAHLR